VAAQVRPDPVLQLKYFWQRDVTANRIFSLAVVVANSGNGTAHDFAITSAQVRGCLGDACNRRSSSATLAQPQIYDNEKGLLVNFHIVDVRVADAVATGQASITATVGDIAPNSAVTVVWSMVASLNGTFSGYVRRSARRTSSR
jgi:hypothetical protein